jgi:endoglucanase
MRRSVVFLVSLPLAVVSACASTAPPNESTPTPGETGNGSSSGGHDAGSSNTGGGTMDAGSSSSPPKGSSAPEASAPAAGGYTVSGPTILDSTGKPHLFRGVARPSLEWSSSGDQLNQGDYGVMSAWGANVVRISLNQDFWLQTDASGSSNPSYDPSYAATVDQQVQWAETAMPKPMDVILDLHWSDKGSFGNEAQCKGAASGCQQLMADPHSTLFWQQVAAKYKNDPHVLFELYNEPNLGGYQPQSGNWQAWLNGDTTNSYGYTVVGMQQLYDTVRAAGANNLVVIGGLAWASDLSGVSSNPVSGTNIVYATHPYQTDPQSMWTANFGSLSAKYPIIATEFGDRSTSCTTAYASNFIAYANKKATNGDNPPNELSWTAWAFYVAPNSCTFPTLLMDWYTPNPFGTAVENALMAGP